MSIFNRRFDKHERSNQTSVARWHRPEPDREFNQPEWQPIKRPPKSRAPVEGESIPLPLDAADGEASSSVDVPVRNPAAGLFDDQELAVVAARTAQLAFEEGEAAGRAADLAEQTRVLDMIEREVTGFARTVELPVAAIRRELVLLLDAMLERLELPAEADDMRTRLVSGIECCLRELRTPAPLVLRLNDDDAQLVDHLLTKMADNSGRTELSVERAEDQPRGTVRVSWPGGGLERVIAGRHAGLHAVLESLATSATHAAAEDRPQGDRS